MIKIVECPRDAMQGWPHLIQTETKIKYLNHAKFTLHNSRHISHFMGFRILYLQLRITYTHSFSNCCSSNTVTINQR